MGQIKIKGSANWKKKWKQPFFFFLQMATLGTFMDFKSEHIGHAAKTCMWTYRFGNNQEN